VDQKVPEIVRIGVANARIKCVTRQRVEYLDEAGQECFIDLDECAENWRNEDEDDFDLLTSEDRDSAATTNSRRHVGERGMLEDLPWFKFMNKRRTRFEFWSLNEAYTLKLQLMKVRNLTLDAN
jgi:hypothetical protein